MGKSGRYLENKYYLNKTLRQLGVLREVHAGRGEDGDERDGVS